jgi:hypothetical protein
MEALGRTTTGRLREVAVHQRQGRREAYDDGWDDPTTLGDGGNHVRNGVSLLHGGICVGGRWLPRLSK